MSSNKDLHTLFKEHRFEYEILTDDVALFVLLFIGYYGPVDINSLGSDFGLPTSQISQTLDKLLRPRFIALTEKIVYLNSAGYSFLREIGMTSNPFTHVVMIDEGEVARQGVRIVEMPPSFFDEKRDKSWMLDLDELHSATNVDSNPIVERSHLDADPKGE